MSSTFRKEYRELSPAEKENVEQIKDAAERLEALIYGIPTHTDMDRVHQRSEALSRLEETVMWAVKAAT